MAEIAFQAARTLLDGEEGGLAAATTTAAAAGTATCTSIRGGGATPKKRAIILTAFLACLSFLFIVVNMIVSSVMTLVENEKVWRHVADTFGTKNDSVCFCGK